MGGRQNFLVAVATMATVHLDPAAYEKPQIELFGQKVQERLRFVFRLTLTYMISFIATVKTTGSQTRCQNLISVIDGSELVVSGSEEAFNSDRRQGGHGENTTMKDLILYKLYHLKKCVMVVLGEGQDMFLSKIEASTSETQWKSAWNDCMDKLDTETAYYASLCSMKNGDLYLFVQSLMNANTPFNPSLASKICGKRKASEAEEAEEKEATKISPVVFQNEEDPKETSTDEVFKKRRCRGKKLEALLREIEDLRCLLAEKQDAYDVLKRQYASIKKRLAKYVQQHCTKANVERDLELIRVKQKCQDLEQQILLLKQEILLLKKDDDNKGDNNEKGDDKETAEDKKIIQRLQDQISRKEEEAANDKKQVLRLCKEYLEKAGIKDVELESLRAQVEDLKTKLGNYKTQLSEKDKELGKKTDDNETLCAQVEDLKTKLGNYKTQLSEKDKELGKKTDDNETLRAQVEDLKTKLGNYKTQLS